MDEAYKNERFLTLRLKESVVKDFRKFCLMEGTSQSVTLARMMAFFKDHQLRPGDDPPNDIKRVERKVLTRLNYLIAVIKDIEKTQTLPTVGMTTAFFEAIGILKDEKKPSKKPILLEKKFQNRTLEEELQQLKDKNLL